MKVENMINITGVNLVEFVKRVYELSSPQGLGFLHYKNGALTDEEAKQLISPKIEGCQYPKNIVVDMDYVKGRACKMVVFKENDKLYIRNSWYDHMDEQLKELLISTLPKYDKLPEINTQHSPACNCLDCQTKQFMKGEK